MEWVASISPSTFLLSLPSYFASWAGQPRKLSLGLLLPEPSLFIREVKAGSPSDRSK
uniref:Uncharacterized protein n=1 Tax=Picea sitchensis TaxID=3332 RepID=A0A6B9XYI4_PICSI|nr:hypothetical protein Q903MT_gene5713 [Picea sitchensis]